MSEHRSRLNACNTTAGWDLDHYRWVERMRTPFLTQQLWRKSSQVRQSAGKAVVAGLEWRRQEGRQSLQASANAVRLGSGGQGAGCSAEHERLLTASPAPAALPQWFVLNRKHAELVLADRRVEAVFRRHCRTMYETDRGSERVCYSGARLEGERGRDVTWCS